MKQILLLKEHLLLFILINVLRLVIYGYPLIFYNHYLIYVQYLDDLLDRKVNQPLAEFYDSSLFFVYYYIHFIFIKNVYFRCIKIFKYFSFLNHF